MCDDPLVAPHVRVTNAVNDSTEISMASNGSKTAVAYRDKRSGHTNVWFSLLEADGTRSTVPDLAVTTYTTTSEGLPYNRPQVVWAGTRWIVTWVEGAYESGTSLTRVRLRAITTSGALEPLDLRFSAIGGVQGVSLAYHPTFGCALVYTAYLDRMYFQKLGATCDAPETPTIISPGALAGSSYGWDSDASVVISPTGEYGVLTQDNGGGRTAFFIRFNPDGSRTKTIQVLRDLPYGPIHPVLAHDGVTWFTVILEELSFTPKSVIVARGEDLATRTKLFSDTTSTTAPLLLPRFVLNGGVLELLFSRRPPGTAATLHFGRYAVPPFLTTAPTPLSAIVDVAGTNTVATDQGLVFLQSGSALLAGWADNRWGAYEIYNAAIDRRACP
jgi:hypothetical protein